MKKTNTYIGFSKDKTIILNEEIPIKFTTSGYYYIPIGKVVDGNHGEALKKELMLFFNNINELSNKQKQKFAIKLPRQFSLPDCDKHITLLKDDNINDKQDFNFFENVNTNCKVFPKKLERKTITCS